MNPLQAFLLGVLDFNTVEHAEPTEAEIEAYNWGRELMSFWTLRFWDKS